MDQPKAWDPQQGEDAYAQAVVVLAKVRAALLELVGDDHGDDGR
jgi:hypothetical protein